MRAPSWSTLSSIFPNNPNSSTITYDASRKNLYFITSLRHYFIFPEPPQCLLTTSPSSASATSPALSSASSSPQKSHRASAPHKIRDRIDCSSADVVCETSSLNAATGKPATDHIKAALELGAHAITANKGPVVHAFAELTALAEEKDRRFLFESTVMDGVPIFSLFPLGLPAA